MKEYKETGQLAYEAYRRAKGGYDIEIIMEEWHRLSLYEQDAWREAAHAAIRKGWVESQRPPRKRRFFLRRRHGK